jgi:DNA-binding response OmpR family regulator
MDTKKTIIVVDDNPDIVDIAKRMLESKGYNVLTAYNGAELFACLKEHKPALIILDILMPKMDGLEVLTRLKNTSETSSIPVIMLTGLAQYEDVLKGYKSGADYYISKPFTGTTLLNGVNLVLGSGKRSEVVNA